ncbi:hypothetical protein [Marinicella sp. W31]|uniref:hypothetical protein n=1 Tax=Marinicella sp. W31 TaxID=3023713 RepID=UPI003758493C
MRIFIFICLYIISCSVSAQFPAQFDLSSVDGNSGFRLVGEVQNDAFVNVVSDAGDLNGDGISDIITCGTVFIPLSADEDACYVVFGSNNAFNSTFDLATLDGTNGFKILGENSSNRIGADISRAGDINGDGIDDLMIAVDFGEPGYAYVIYGSNSGFTTPLQLSSLNGSNGFRINGDATERFFGSAVSGIGDYNNDGIDDMAVGATGTSPNGFRSGTVYVIFGQNGNFASNFDVATLNGTNGFALNGASQTDLAGRYVSELGDVNGDGVDDFILGATGADPTGTFGSGRGGAYVIFGTNAAMAAEVELSALDGSNGFGIVSEPFFLLFPDALSGAGDINGDGLNDIIIGSSPSSTNGINRTAYVVFGSNSGFNSTLDLANLDGQNGFLIRSLTEVGNFAQSVSSAGDINGDGLDDVIIGSPSLSTTSNQNGASYILYGNSGAFQPAFDLTTLDGSNGFQINGADPTNNSGRYVSYAGDFNNDGHSDVVISNGFTTDAGSAHIVFGIEGVQGPMEADLTLSKTLDTPAPYAVGQSIQFSISVNNLGANLASNVIVNDTPTNLTIDSVNNPNCNAFPCALGVLSVGQTEVITVTATINGVGVFSNTATVTSSTADPNSANNTDSAGGTVLPPMVRSVPTNGFWFLLLLFSALIGVIYLSGISRETS